MPIYQVSPFNQARFDQCMLWFMRKHGRPLSQFPMVKLHVMTDAYHLLAAGMPVIGGKAEAWPKGPVVKKAYDRIMRIARNAKDRRESPFVVDTDPNLNFYRFGPRQSEDLDADDFSLSEVQAMELAWGAVTGKHKGKDGEDYFHDPDTFIGRAWHAAKEGNSPIDWEVVFDSYDELHCSDHRGAKAIAGIGAK